MEGDFANFRGMLKQWSDQVGRVCGRP